jgi:hypothetical protein
VRVEFYELQAKVGELRYADGEFTIIGAKYLERILMEPICTLDGKRITATDDPEAFMENLRFQYKSVYFKAGKQHRTD